MVPPRNQITTTKKQNKAGATLPKPFLRSKGPTTRSVGLNVPSSSAPSLVGHHTATTVAMSTTATAQPLFAVPSSASSSSSSSPTIESVVGRMLRSRKTRRLQQYPTDRTKIHSAPLPTSISSSTTTSPFLHRAAAPSQISTRFSSKKCTSKPSTTTSTKPETVPVVAIPTKTTGSEGETIGRWERWERMAFLRSVRVHGRGNWKAISEDIPTRTAIQVKSHAQVVLAKPNIFHELDEYDKAQATLSISEKRRHRGPAATRKACGSHAKKPKRTTLTTKPTTMTKKSLRLSDTRSNKAVTDTAGVTLNISTDDEGGVKKGNSKTKSNAAAAAAKRDIPTQSSSMPAPSSFNHSHIFSTSHNVTVTMTLTGTMGVSTMTKATTDATDASTASGTPSFNRSSRRSLLTTMMPTPPTVPFSSSFEIGFMHTRSRCLPMKTSFHSQPPMTTSAATTTVVKATTDQDEKHEAALALLGLATTPSCIYGD